MTLIMIRFDEKTGKEVAVTKNKKIKKIPTKKQIKGRQDNRKNPNKHFVWKNFNRSLPNKTKVLKNSGGGVRIKNLPTKEEAELHINE